jgi:hypothetical protein
VPCRSAHFTTDGDHARNAYFSAPPQVAAVSITYVPAFAREENLLNSREASAKENGAKCLKLAIFPVLSPGIIILMDWMTIALTAEIGSLLDEQESVIQNPSKLAAMTTIEVINYCLRSNRLRQLSQKLCRFEPNFCPDISRTILTPPPNKTN